VNIDSNKFFQEKPRGAPAEPRGRQRIESLDVLRGVAVLGILVMNITSFTMPTAAYSNPYVYGDMTGWNYWFWALSHLLAREKFFSLFSMLYGASMLLLAEKSAARGESPASVHYRRSAWLLLFGLMHAYLLWHGDVLVYYALTGLAVFQLREGPPRLMLVAALGCLAVGVGLVVLMAAATPILPETIRQEILLEVSPPEDVIAEEVETYRSGWGAIAAHRFVQLLAMHFGLFPLMLCWRVAGLMLLGMVLYRWRFLTGDASRRVYAGGVVAAVALGLLPTACSIALTPAPLWEGNPLAAKLALSIPNYVASVFTALGWASLVMLWCKRTRAGRLRRALGAVGRMAFTNYLTQTLICTTLFFGYGFGLFGWLERVELFGVVVAIWLAQLLWSSLLMRRFRYGPFEWLWRKLTYAGIHKGPASRVSAPPPLPRAPR